MACWAAEKRPMQRSFFRAIVALRRAVRYIFTAVAQGFKKIVGRLEPWARDCMRAIVALGRAVLKIVRRLERLARYVSGRAKRGMGRVGRSVRLEISAALKKLKRTAAGKASPFVVVLAARRLTK